MSQAEWDVSGCVSEVKKHKFLRFMVMLHLLIIVTYFSLQRIALSAEDECAAMASCVEALEEEKV